MSASAAITGRAVWRAEELARATDWIRPITPAEQEELDAAMRAVTRRGLAWREMTREDFPIPRLARALAEVAHELEDGRGVVLLRRLPVERYTEDELMSGARRHYEEVRAQYCDRPPTHALPEFAEHCPVPPPLTPPGASRTTPPRRRAGRAPRLTERRGC